MDVERWCFLPVNLDNWQWMWTAGASLRSMLRVDNGCVPLVLPSGQCWQSTMDVDCRSCPPVNVDSQQWMWTADAAHRSMLTVDNGCGPPVLPSGQCWQSTMDVDRQCCPLVNVDSRQWMWTADGACQSMLTVDNGCGLPVLSSGPYWQSLMNVDHRCCPPVNVDSRQWMWTAGASIRSMLTADNGCGLPVLPSCQCYSPMRHTICEVFLSFLSAYYCLNLMVWYKLPFKCKCQECSLQHWVVTNVVLLPTLTTGPFMPFFVHRPSAYMYTSIFTRITAICLDVKSLGNKIG